MRRPRALLLAVGIAVIGLLGLGGCGNGEAAPERAEDGQAPIEETMELTSTAFGDGEAIPERFSCEGENVPPPLSWSEVPDGTASLAVVVTDPDAPSGTFVHWVVYGLPASLEGLEPGELPEDAEQARGSSDNATYVGPCPPEGDPPHRYVFRIFALASELSLPPEPPAEDAIAAIREQAVAAGELVGTFGR